MGSIEHSGSGRLAPLASRSLVGRAKACEVVVDDPRVSGEHALVTWRSDGWQIRDLGSRNGTWVDGGRLGAGERAPLRRGTRLGFGVADDPWTILDDAPPGPLARDLGTGRLVPASHGLLALPASETPRATICLGERGQWVAELDGAVRDIASGDVLVVDGSRWLLLLPASLDPVSGTVEARDASAITVATVRLTFRVSQDEEHVDVALLPPGGDAVALPARSSHYMLLTLARARLGDAARGLPEAEQGWIYASDLADGLGHTADRLNIEIFRARSQLAKAGVVDAARLVERRPLSRQLRIGVANLQVVRG